jgi:hypothetical protein
LEKLPDEAAYRLRRGATTELKAWERKRRRRSTLGAKNSEFRRSGQMDQPEQEFLVAGDINAEQADNAAQRNDRRRCPHDIGAGLNEVSFLAQRPGLIFKLKNETTHRLSPASNAPQPTIPL